MGSQIDWELLHCWSLPAFQGSCAERSRRKEICVHFFCRLVIIAVFSGEAETKTGSGRFAA